MLDSISNSLNHTRNSITQFIDQQPLLFVLIAILGIWSIIAQSIKNQLKKKYVLPFENKINTQDKYFYIRYFRKIHTIDSIGIILILVLTFIYLLTKIEIIGSVLAIGIGAVILTFQTFMISFLMYFILMKKYQVGDHIKIHIDDKNILGEILNIGGLYLGVAGKNEYGESTDEFYNIPNNQLRQHPICRINLSQENYTKESINIPFDPDTFRFPFDETVKKIEHFLDDLLDLRAASQVGNYKTYIGVKYKISFSYHEEKTNIWIGFITRRKDESHKMRKILTYIESLKRKKS